MEKKKLFEFARQEVIKAVSSLDEEFLRDVVEDWAYDNLNTSRFTDRILTLDFSDSVFERMREKYYRLEDEYGKKEAEILWEKFMEYGSRELTEEVHRLLRWYELDYLSDNFWVDFDGVDSGFTLWIKRKVLKEVKLNADVETVVNDFLEFLEDKLKEAETEEDVRRIIEDNVGTLAWFYVESSEDLNKLKKALDEVDEVAWDFIVYVNVKKVLGLNDNPSPSM